MEISGEPRSRFYGRRSARRLRGARVDALKASLARYELTLPLPALPQPLWLEIGFGSGEHLLAQATANPDVMFIGCEPYLNGVGVLVRLLDEAGIANVRIYPEDARLLLAQLPDASVARAFALFADPWPKTRHNNRRIISPETLDQLDRVLTPEGRVHLATDHQGLSEWYQAVVPAHPAFRLQPAIGYDAKTRPADWPATRYEAKAKAAGRQPWYFTVRRRDRPSG